MFQSIQLQLAISMLVEERKERFSIDRSTWKRN